MQDLGGEAGAPTAPAELWHAIQAPLLRLARAEGCGYASPPLRLVLHSPHPLASLKLAGVGSRQAVVGCCHNSALHSSSGARSPLRAANLVPTG